MTPPLKTNNLRTASSCHISPGNLPQGIWRDNYELRNDMESHNFEPCTVLLDFFEFIKTNIIPRLELSNNKQRQCLLIAQILARMLETNNSNKSLSDSRNTGSKANSRIPIYDALIKANILKVCLGCEISGKVSRYGFACKGKHIFNNHKTFDAIDFLFDTPITQNKTSYNSDRAPVILRTKTENSKKQIPFPRRMDKKTLDFVQQLEESIMRINKANLAHKWEYPVLNKKGEVISISRANPCVRAIFNEDFEHGGRVYSEGASGYQSIKRNERHKMLVNGNPTAEIDFSGCQLRMLYHDEGIDYTGDVYMPEKIFPELYTGKYPDEYLVASRNYIKIVTNIIINADFYGKAIKSICKEYRDDKSGLLEQIIYKICKTKPSRLVNRIKELHEPIQKYFFTGRGLRLQGEETKIIIKVLDRFVKLGKPALSLHDAIICREEDIQLGQRLMSEFYVQKFRFEPVIKLQA